MSMTKIDSVESEADARPVRLLVADDHRMLRNGLRRSPA